MEGFDFLYPCFKHGANIDDHIHTRTPGLTLYITTSLVWSNIMHTEAAAINNPFIRHLLGCITHHELMRSQAKWQMQPPPSYPLFFFIPFFYVIVPLFSKNGLNPHRSEPNIPHRDGSILIILEPNNL